MKKICIVLSIAFEFSIPVMNATPEVNSYDDCDHALPSPNSGLKAPTNTPQAGPANNEAEMPSDSLAALLFLPVTTKLLDAEVGEPLNVPDMHQDEDSTDGSVEDHADSLVASVHEADVSAGATESVEEVLDSFSEIVDTHVSKLHLYYYEQDGDEFILKRHTLENLQADYDSLLPGQTYVATFKPNISLAINGEVTSHLTPPSFWDTFPVFAKIRAWTKWWLNPYAWWDSSYYSLNYNDSKIDWDAKNISATLTTNLKKDQRYLLSQLAFYLYSQWGSQYINPYIVPETRRVFDSVMNLRFNKVEKVAFEGVGFKNVRIETRVNLVSKYVEYCVLAEK